MFLSWVHSTSLFIGTLKEYIPVVMVCHELEFMINSFACTWSLLEEKEKPGIRG